MTKKLRMFILLTLSILTLSIALGTVAGAAEDIEANRTLAEEKHSALLKVQEQYYMLGDVGKQANEYVTQYTKYFNTLNDFVLAQDGANVLIHLYYEQGVTAGHLAFIYYSYANDTRIADSDREALYEAHDALQAQIYAAKTAEEISAVSEALFADKGIYAQMFVTIYDKMLDALLIENDSSAVIQKIAVAREDIKACTVVKTSEQYEEIYNRALTEVTIQRNKDNTVAEINKIFSILRPGESIESNSAAMAAIEYIRRDTTTLASDMNAYLKGVIDPLLAEKKDGGAYVDGYVDKLLALIADTVAKADGENKAATLSPIFENFTLDIKKAAVKDVIATDIAAREYASDEKMLSLESSYNADGKIIDGCKNEAELLFETERARLRADLYGEFVEASKRILSFGAFDSLSAEAAKKFGYYDYNILSKDRSTEGAKEACIAEYETFVAELNDLIVAAESTAFANKHSAILQKELASITLADKEALLSAINDAKNLSEGSAKVLEANGTVDKIAEKYKEIAKQEVDGALGEDRKSYAYELKDQIGKLSASSDADKLPALIEAADGIIEKAKLIDSVLDLLEAIKATDGYKDFSDANKKTLESTATDAAEAILKSDTTEAAKKLAADATVALKRAEACAILDSLLAKNKNTDSETYGAISSVIEKAKKSINGLNDVNDIIKATEDAIFDVESELIKKELSDKARLEKEKIDGLGFISVADKDAYKDRVDKLLAAQRKAIDEVSNKTERDAAVKQFEDGLDKIKDEASGKNAESRAEENKEAFGKLDEKLAECRERIDSLKFLSDDEKNALKTQADALNITSKQKLEEAATSEDAKSSLNKALSDMEALAKKAEADDEAVKNGERAALDTEVKSRYDSLISKLGSLEYLSDLIENELKINAGNIYKEFSERLSATSDREALASLKSDTIGKLDKISEEADVHQLEGAKLAAKNSVAERANAAKKKIVGFKHLDADSKSRLVGEIDDEVANANSHIEIAPDIQTVKAIESSALATIVSVENEGQRLEDEAFVRALRPLIIALACIGVVEAIIAVAIFIYKRKVILAVAMPTVSYALALTPVGAQVVAITLAVVDLALAVYIGYWIVILHHAWKRDKENGEEGFEELKVEEEPDFEIEIVELPEEEIKEEEPEETPEDDEIEIEIVELPAEEADPEPITDFMYEPMVISDTVESITVEEAEEMMTDEEAIELEQMEIDLAPEFREEYHGTKKAEINIDTISACFSSGDKVTLNTLKEKGLVSKQAGSVKILARGRLDKPLTVVAQKFSVAAVKMIVLTGGSVIIAEPAPERK